LPSLVSIHDVMPDTLELVRQILERLDTLGVSRVTLLVVPGMDWNEKQMASLNEFQNQGFELAGHGWLHRARHIRGFYHRLHSALLSRNAAEHLALDNSELLQMVDNCYRWFGANDLTAPNFYVPPAWAMGALSKVDLQRLPFRYYETLSGILDSDSGRFFTLPLTGYEADNRFRVASLSVFNGLNLARARLTGSPLRIGIHPYDFQHGLSDSLLQHLGDAGTCLLPADLNKNLQPA